VTYSGFILAAMTRRRFRNPFAGVLAHLGLLSSLAVLAGAMLANGDGAGDGAGAAGGEGGPAGAAAGGAAGQQGSGAGGEGGGTGTAGTGADDKGGAAKTEKVTFTKEQQAEVDRIASEARAAAAAKATKDAEAAAKQAAERAKMDEADRLKAEKADADKKATEATEKANTRAIRADAKVAAVAAGVGADVVTEFLAVVDLSDVKVDDDGEPDPKAIKKAIDATLAKPTFKAAFIPTTGKGAGSSGGDHNGGGDKGRAKTIEDAVAARLAS